GPGAPRRRASVDRRCGIGGHPPFTRDATHDAQIDDFHHVVGAMSVCPLVHGVELLLETHDMRRRELTRRRAYRQFERLADGPLPPNAKSVNLCGSRPRCVDTAFTARIMLAFASWWTPYAASRSDRPSGVATCACMTRPAAAASIGIAPSSSAVGLM